MVPVDLLNSRPNRLKQLIIAVPVAGLLLLLAGYGVLSWQRQATIREVAADAQAAFSGDRTEALLAHLRSDASDLVEKNRIIWVLGELRDRRAVPELSALFRSGECDHARCVCQKEVRKALAKIDGEIPNPFFWQRV